MNNVFKKAKPVWVNNKQTEVNIRVQFKAFCPKADIVEICIATSGTYQLFVNGEFAACGPARAGKGHFRTDKFDISRFLTKPTNAVIIEVAGYYCTNFYIMRQPSFLQAEIICDGENVLGTGYDFTARINPAARQKVQRYSYQRTFAESYRVGNIDNFFTDGECGCEPLEECDKKTLTERKVPYPLFEKITPKPLCCGEIKHVIPEKYEYDRYVMFEGDPLQTAWKVEEFDSFPEKDYQELAFFKSERAVTDTLFESYNDYVFPHNATGMISLDVIAESDVTLFLAFDELMRDGVLEPRRCRICNIVKYNLKKGNHKLHTFEVYTLKYLRIIASGGKCTVKNIALTEYKHPPVNAPHAKNADLQKIIDAAVETYRQNAVDVFTDCPSRERAGWLCDSYFSARAEYALTGKNLVEESFLENYLHEETYGKIPKGMVPMCYPADHPVGRYIPSWAMFFVAELHDYINRTGNFEFVRRFKDKIYGIINFFKRFENEDGILDGLLENDNSWVFVEWSRANQLVDDINYPNNMMYYMTLKSASEMFNDKILHKKAEALRDEIIKQSFDGEFFRDQARYINGKKTVLPEATEVCQYYAFFTGVATPKTHPKLFKTLLDSFGPSRDTARCYPKIAPSAPFIGNYMRLQIMADNGYFDEVLKNITGYFLNMAEETGTLWESAEGTNSCNHGFASAVLYWIKQAADNGIVI